MIPPDGVVTATTRQQSRRVAREHSRCSRCGKALAGQPLCFDDGKDAHLSCSTIRNEALESARQEMRHQESTRRAMELGLATPTPSLWTPPSKPEAPTLDLSTARLLG